MKAVIPAAGEGTRLYPQTHTKPKAMVRVAGKPILGHLLDQLATTEIDSVVIVVGAQRGEQIIDYATEAYGGRFTFSFPEQTVARGLGHGIYQARGPVGEEPMLVVLGDMLFLDGYRPFIEAHREGEADATIGVHEVDEPQHYGVVELGGGMRIERLVEKPDDPRSNYAISGLYAIEDTAALFGALETLIETETTGTGGEFQLTDALQRMVERGSTVRAQRVSNWYDCGRPEPLLDVNRVLLDRRNPDPPENVTDSVVVPPVDIGENVVIESSIVGPHVSVDKGAEIRESIVESSIVGRDATLTGAHLERSLVGDDADVRDSPARLNVGPNGDLNL